MPIKFKETQTTVDRATGKKSTQNFYMQSTALKELLDVYTATRTEPKMRQKVRNELVKRKVELPVLES
jgi:hypothetical protein|tara:strand:- start:746 stop:949 length:204 start_codon:yes stop_codon:yes gene_type:complete